MNIVWFRVSGAIAAACACMICALPADEANAQAKSVPLAMPPQTLRLPAMKLDALREEVIALNAFIGGYPPRFSGEPQRAEIYRRWADALQNARAFLVQAPKDARVHFLLAELFRHGHNMDVAGSAESAEDAINHCLDVDSNYVPCLFSASYFYLSLDPKFADRAERSLLRLRRIFGKSPNLEVERALVQAYQHQGRKADALKQLDYYLKLDPKSAWAKSLRASLQSNQSAPNKKP